MRVVVTGGSGKGGQEVVRALAEAGHEVTNFDRRYPDEPLPGGFCRVDLTDAGQVYDAVAQVRPEGVCHLAADPVPAGQTRVEVFTGNVTSAYCVLQAAADFGARRIVYASSEMATGLLTEGVAPSRIPFDESERVPSPNAYALSKYLSEVIAESFAVRYPETTFAGLRLTNIIRASDELAFRQTDDAMGRSHFWSYVDARDVGGAFLAALEGESAGHEVFLVAAADHYGTKPLRELMATYYDGYDAVDPGLPDDASAFDCAKMARAFGWRPAHSLRP